MRAFAAAAAALAGVCTAARADMASPRLARYEKPVDQAIERALKYLAASQDWDERADGRDDAKRRRRATAGSFGNAAKGCETAVTSLCVMAFLCKGYTPGTGPHGEVINRGVDFVLASQQDNGLLATSAARGIMYNHGISTLMLSEVSGMLDPARAKAANDALGAALKVILAAQRVTKPPPHRGGWRYQHNSTDSDISCTGWQLMALRSARSNGAPVPKEAVEAAVKYILGLQSPDGGFGYSAPGQAGLGRTGTGLLCLELCGQHGEKPTLDAGEWILRNIGATNKGAARQIRDGHFFYAVYYVSQGMFQLGGRHWEEWAETMYQTLLKTQQPDGSWAGEICPTYSTAMGVLAMGVVYRQLPIYQR